MIKLEISLCNIYPRPMPKRRWVLSLTKHSVNPSLSRDKNKDAAVIISPQDYERLIRLNLEEFQQFREDVAQQAAQSGLTEAKLSAILDQ